MINPVVSEIIRKINAREITSSSSVSDLKKALTLMVAAYRDYQHYEIELDRLMNDFDESLEEFDPDTWFYRGTEKADLLATDCVESLSVAAMCFSRITEHAKDNLIFVLKTVLSAKPAVQKSVLGKAYKIEVDELDMKIDSLFDMLDDSEYKPAIPDNFDIFLENMDGAFLSDVL